MKRVLRRLLKRDFAANKGDFGHVFVLAGSSGMTGAARLCGQACLRAGAGLVTVGLPRSAQLPVACGEPALMTLGLEETADGGISLRALPKIKAFSRSCTVLAAGPGLSRRPATQQLIRKTISQVELPMVIDADALNALVGQLDILRHNPAPKIITPHPGEMGRLTGKTAAQVQKSRRTLAKETASRYNIITVLKGAGTLVAAPDGRVAVNTTGNPGLAKGGTGDVLTGIIAALLAQKVPLFEAARLGVYLHGLAGDLAVKQTGQVCLMPADLLDFLPQAFRKACR